MIIQDADRFGLSQLYQLRGRVGRSNRMAYAFLLYQRDVYKRQDLFQIGCVGLMKAVDHFDPGRMVKFSTYAAVSYTHLLKK